MSSSSQRCSRRCLPLRQPPARFTAAARNGVKLNQRIVVLVEFVESLADRRFVVVNCPRSEHPTHHFFIFDVEIDDRRQLEVFKRK